MPHDCHNCASAYSTMKIAGCVRSVRSKGSALPRVSAYIVSTTELVRLLVDVVAKNGNLLIGVGPDPAGVVPAARTA